VDQRAHQLGSIGNPATERRAREGDAVPAVDLCLTVQRLMVTVLADHDLPQQARPRQTLLNGLWRFGGARDRLFTALAGEDPSHVLDDLEGGWRVVELFRHLFAALRQLRAARSTTALRLRQCVLHALARQVLGQRPTNSPTLPPVWRRRNLV